MLTGTDKKVVLTRKEGESIADFEVRLSDKKALLKMRHKCTIISIKQPPTFTNVKHTDCKYNIYILEKYPDK